MTQTSNPHLTHCYQGEYYSDSCKYGEDDTCPAKPTEVQRTAHPQGADDELEQVRKIVANRMSLLQAEDHHIRGISAADEARLEHYIDEVMDLLKQHHKPQPVGDGELEQQVELVVDRVINWASEFHADDGPVDYIMNPAVGSLPRIQTVKAITSLIAAQTDAARIEAVASNNNLHRLHERNIDDVVSEAVNAAQRELLERVEAAVGEDSGHNLTSDHLRAEIRQALPELQHLKSQQTEQVEGDV
jgi:hypothetical protein